MDARFGYVRLTCHIDPTKGIWRTSGPFCNAKSSLPAYRNISPQQRKLCWKAIYNGNGIKRSPIPSVIIRVIKKIGRPRSGSLKLEKSWVWYLTELDDTKSCYQLMKTMAKFEKETRNRLYVFIKKKLLTRRNAEQQHAHMTRSVHLHMHDVLTVPLTVLYTVQVQAWRITVLLVLKSGWW